MENPSNSNHASYETLDNFRIVKELGRGATGIVKLGLDLQTGKLFALKLLKVPKLMDKFLTEYRILETAQHAHIIKVLGVREEGTYTKMNGEQVKVCYFVMKYAPHGEVFDIIFKKGSFSENLSRYYFLQILSSLEYLHSNKISHRDIKPENLLIDESYQLILSDFGYAKTVPEGNITKTRLGTPGYVAPEILLGGEYDPLKADIFSAGVTLFVIYSRSPPFQEASLNNRAYRTLFDNSSFMFAHYQANFQKAYPEPLRALFLNTMCFTPESRLTLEQIKQNEWVSKAVDESKAHLEIQHLLGINNVIEVPTNPNVNGLPVLKAMHQARSREKLQVAQHMVPQTIKDTYIQRMENIPAECHFDYVLKCKDKVTLLNTINSAVKELGGSLDKGEENSLTAKLISSITDFEQIVVDIKLYEDSGPKYYMDVGKLSGSYFGYLEVKKDLFKALESAAHS